MSNKDSPNIESVRNIIMIIITVIFSVSLFDALYGFKKLITPGISLVYNALGPNIVPNMVTLVVFDWRGFDTLGESLILVTAVLVVLLILEEVKLKIKKSTLKKERMNND